MGGGLTLVVVAANPSSLPSPLAVPRGGRQDSLYAASEGGDGDLASRGHGAISWRGGAWQHVIFLSWMLLPAVRCPVRRQHGDSGLGRDLQCKGPGAEASDMVAAAMSLPSGMAGQEAASCGGAWDNGSRNHLRRFVTGGEWWPERSPASVVPDA